MLVCVWLCCVLVFFFFKQKTAYEIMPSLVGSEMCIRDSSSSALRRTLGLSTTFEPTCSVGNVCVSYTIDRRASMLSVSVDARGLNKAGCSEMILLNELDGGLFDRYRDSNGLALVGKEIGTWEETSSDCVMF